MRKAPNKRIEKFRIRSGRLGTSTLAGNNGAFMVPYRDVVLMVIASNGVEWDHVSVSLPDRCPTWEEMCHVKQLFFHGNEPVVQYHPRSEDYVDFHPYCLHLWRPQRDRLPLPPPALVGPMRGQRNLIQNRRRAV